MKNALETASVLLALGMLLAGTSGCVEKDPGGDGGSSPASSPASEPPSGFTLTGRSGAAYKVAPVENPGSLSVVALYGGETIPEQAEIPVNINVEHCAHKVLTEDVIVDKGSRGLKNVVVLLEGVKSGKAVPEQVTITNRDCAFEPHVSVAVKGTKIKVTNADPFLHTTHPSLNDRDLFNVPLTDQNAEYPARPIPNTGLMTINCDVHKWMKAYMVVHDNPYLAVSDAAGRLKIDQIPAGTFAYRAWHEKLGEQKGKVTIEAGKEAQLKLTFTPQE